VRGFQGHVVSLHTYPVKGCHHRVVADSLTEGIKAARHAGRTGAEGEEKVRRS